MGLLLVSSGKSLQPRSGKGEGEAGRLRPGVRPGRIQLMEMPGFGAGPAHSLANWVVSTF